MILVCENMNHAPAEIAQLVEHNLAKVGVASSSLVFRSSFRHSFFHSIFSVPAVVRLLALLFYYRCPLNGSSIFGSADFRLSGFFGSADISGWCGLDNQVHPEWPVLKGLFTG